VSQLLDRLRAELTQQRAENQTLREQIARLRGADREPPDLTRARRRQRSPEPPTRRPMIGSIASLVVGILLSAAPSPATCGHWLDWPAPHGG
jgi:hypothetical protein